MIRKSLARHAGRAFFALLMTAVPAAAQMTAERGGAVPGPFPLFPRTNWWNLDVSAAPVDPQTNSYIAFVGPDALLHPNFGGISSRDPMRIYGHPYIVVRNVGATNRK